MNTQNGFEFKTLNDINKFVEMSKTEIANMYANKYKNDIFIIGSDTDIYYFNEITKLWICGTKEAYTNFVANVFQQTADNLQKTLKKLIKENETIPNKVIDINTYTKEKLAIDISKTEKNITKLEKIILNHDQELKLKETELEVLKVELTQLNDLTNYVA